MSGENGSAASAIFTVVLHPGATGLAACLPVDAATRVEERAPRVYVFKGTAADLEALLARPESFLLIEIGERVRGRSAGPEEWVRVAIRPVLRLGAPERRELDRLGVTLRSTERADGSYEVEAWSGAIAGLVVLPWIRSIEIL